MPFATPIAYPLINGNRSDFSSVTVEAAGEKYNGVKSLNYKQTLDPGIIRGNRAQVLATTRGTLDAEGSIELYLAEYYALIRRLTVLGAGRLGFMEVKFDILASYAEGPLDVLTTDKLVGCRLKTADRTPTEGNEGISVKCDLHIMYIEEAKLAGAPGLLAISPQQLLK